MDVRILATFLKTLISRNNNQKTFNSLFTQRAYLNALAAFFDYGSRVLVSFLLTPILVSGLGKELFGAWQVISRLIGHISSADGSPMQVLKWFIASKQSSDDHELKRRAIGSSIIVWIIILPCVIPIGILILWFLPSIVNISQSSHSIVRIAWIIMLFNLIISGLFLLPKETLGGMNLGYKRIGFTALISILGGIFTALLIYLGYGLVGVAIAQVIITIITGIVFVCLVKRHLSWFGFSKPFPDELRIFFQKSFWYGIWGFIEKALFSSEIIILSIMSSSIIVTSFVLTGYLPQTITTIVMIMIGATTIGIGSMVGLKQFSRVFEIRKELMWITCYISIILGTQIILWNQSFLLLWIGENNYAGNTVNFLILLITIQSIFIRNESYLLDLFLNIKHKAIWGGIAAITTILLATYLTNLWSMVGLCIGILVGRMILILIYPYITSKFLGVNYISQFQFLGRPALFMITIFSLCLHFSQFLIVDNWIHLFLYVSGSLILTTIVSLYLGFTKFQREKIIHRIRKINPLSINV
jgi:O-antigen/teichoic acid export membrane protein